MATMTDNDRIAAWAEYVQDLSAEIDLSTGTLLTEVRAAIDAADQWVDDNRASFNGALSEPFQTWATPRQKAQLLMLVVLRRFNTRAQEEV